MHCVEGSQSTVADRLIDTQKDLDRLAAEVTNVIGIDTEFYSRRTYFRVPCLFQLATAKRVCAIDLLAPLDLRAIEALLYDPKIRKVMHASSEDLRLLYYLFGELPNNVVDTQVACEFVSLEEQPPYQRMVSQFLDVDLSKSSSITTSDWQARPLASEQLNYAIDDVRYLLPLWRTLDQKLALLDRKTWFHEEMSNHILAQRRNMSNGIPSLSGLGNLPRKDRALARILTGWRERVARRSNVPRQWVARDEQIVLALRNRKQSAEHFRELFGKKLGPTLYKAIKRAKKDLARGKLAESSSVEFPWSIKQGQLLSRRLRSVVQQHSEKQQMSRTMLATQNNMLDWSSTYLRKGSFPSSFGRWRENLLGNEFKQVIEEVR